MATKKPEEQGQSAGVAVRTELSPGVKLLRTLQGHEDAVFSVAFDPQGGTLASGTPEAGRMR